MPTANRSIKNALRYLVFGSALFLPIWAANGNPDEAALLSELKQAGVTIHGYQDGTYQAIIGDLKPQNPATLELARQLKSLKALTLNCSDLLTQLDLNNFTRLDSLIINAVNLSTVRLKQSPIVALALNAQSSKFPSLEGLGVGFCFCYIENPDV